MVRRSLIVFCQQNQHTPTRPGVPTPVPTVRRVLSWSLPQDVNLEHVDGAHVDGDSRVIAMPRRLPMSVSLSLFFADGFGHPSRCADALSRFLKVEHHQSTGQPRAGGFGSCQERRDRMFQKMMMVTTRPSHTFSRRLSALCNLLGSERPAYFNLSQLSMDISLKLWLLHVFRILVFFR